MSRNRKTESDEVWYMWLRKKYFPRDGECARCEQDATKLLGMRMRMCDACFEKFTAPEPPKLKR